MKKAFIQTHRAICFIIIIFIAFLNIQSNAREINTDSIFTQIIHAKNIAYINVLQTEVDPMIMELNNWANDAVWNEPNLVKSVSEKLIDYSIANKNDSLLSWSYHYMALSYYYMHYWNLSIDIYQKALNTSWAKNSITAKSFTAFCNLNIGCNYEYLGNYDKAAHYYYHSIKINEGLGLPFVAAEARLDVASLEIRLKNWQKAKENIYQALSVLESHNDSVRLSEGYRMLFLIEIAENDFNEAEVHLNKALNLSLIGNDSERLVKIYLDYGNALLHQKHTADALKTYKQALMHCDSIQFPATYFQVIGSIGRVYLEHKNLSLAEKYLNKSYEGLIKLDANSMLLDIEKNLAMLYATKGDSFLFDHFFQSTLNRKDSLATAEKIRSMSESEVIYKTASKDRKIELQSYQLNIKKYQILLISSVSFILLVSLILVIRLLQKVKIKNKELLERNIELSNQWNKLQGSFTENIKNDNDSILFSKIYSFVVEKEEFTNPDISVDFIAKKMNSNTKYISNAIKSKTGFHFNTFINTYRIEKAKTMLRSQESNKWTLETIADFCGFNNHTTFYKSFKKSTGLTPSVYRKISA